MQTRTTMRYHYTPVRVAKIESTVPPTGKDVKQLELLYIATGSEQWYSPSRKSLTVFSKIKHIATI